MKKFFKWLKNSTKIKRWIFLIIIGLFLVCMGFAKIFVSNELGVKGIIGIIGSFVLGFVCFAVGTVYIQRRTLELLIEGDRKELTKFDKDEKVRPADTGDSVYKKGPNIVVIGGGNGINNVLSGLKKYTNNITAIVSVSNYGKNDEILRKELHLKPTEDIKNSIISLAIDSNKMKRLMNYRFQDGKLRGITFGEVFLSAMEYSTGNFINSIEQTNEVLYMTGKVLPVTLDEMKICAELQDGTVVEEKDKISEIASNHITKINRVYISPSNCRVAPGVLDAIKKADAIVLGPGSLYTNVIPNLLIKNVAKTIKDSKALKIYVSNIMTEPGQTDDFDILDHINAIIEHSGEGVIDFCIADNGEIVPEFLRKYNLQGSNFVEMNASKVRTKGIHIIKASMATTEGTRIIHNCDELARQIVEIICSDWKFKDKNSDEQYVLLNSKLKEENKKVKRGKRIKNKFNKFNKKGVSKHTEKKPRKPSKFGSKYQERIKSIKESEETRKENLRIQKRAEALLKQEQKEKKEKREFLEKAYRETKNKRKK